MTIRDLIQFLADSARNTRDGFDTPVKAISTINWAGDRNVIFTDCCTITMDKLVDSAFNREYVDLIIEEEDF